LSRALAKLDGLEFKGKVNHQIAEILQRKATIDTLRKQTAQAMLAPKSARDEQLTQLWFTAMTRYIETIEALLLTISGDISDTDGMIARYSALKSATLSLRNSAGPEISILSGVMLSQKPLAAEQGKKIEQLQLVSKNHIKRLETLSQNLSASAIPNALDVLKKSYFSDFLPYRDAVFQAAFTGGPYPYPQPEFLKRGVAALDQIAVFNTVIVTTTKQYAESHLKDLKQKIAIQILSSSASCALIILIFFYVHYSIIDPLSRLTSVIRRLADNEFVYRDSFRKIR